VKIYFVAYHFGHILQSMKAPKKQTSTKRKAGRPPKSADDKREKRKQVVMNAAELENVMRLKAITGKTLARTFVDSVIEELRRKEWDVLRAQVRERLLQVAKSSASYFAANGRSELDDVDAMLQRSVVCELPSTEAGYRSDVSYEIAAQTDLLESLYDRAVERAASEFVLYVMESAEDAISTLESEGRLVDVLSQERHSRNKAVEQAFVRDDEFSGRRFVVFTFDGNVRDLPSREDAPRARKLYYYRESI
jgi:hypothetical protein